MCVYINCEPFPSSKLNLKLHGRWEAFWEVSKDLVEFIEGFFDCVCIFNLEQR